MRFEKKHLNAALVAVLLAGNSIASTPAPFQKSVAPGADHQVIAIDGINSIKFMSLPDNAKIKMGVSILTKSEIVAMKNRAVDMRQIRSRGAAGQASAKWQALRNNLQQEHKAIVGAQNAQVLAEFNQVKSNFSKSRSSSYVSISAPVVSAVVGIAQNDAYLMIKGQNFGSNAGKIFLKGDFPGGQIELIPDQGWTDTHLAAKVSLPNGGAMDQNGARLLVVTKEGQSSSEFANVQFKAERAGAIITPNGQIGCSAAAWSNICEVKEGAFQVHHIAFPDGSTYSGHDTYSYTFKNGWKYSYPAWQAGGSDIPGATVSGTMNGQPLDSVSNVENVNIVVNWSIKTDKIDTITSDIIGKYSVFYIRGFYIEGPKGVPWQ